ncbi:hypothetical protein JX266_005587 [Neoarthrinium moseri]|nr:hypothetical protein JX266_005587 [Neoarthrinium moseri]
MPPFTQFSKLPAELQMLIWRSAIPNRGILEIQTAETDDNLWYPTSGYTVQRQLPAPNVFRAAGPFITRTLLNGKTLEENRNAHWFTVKGFEDKRMCWFEEQQDDIMYWNSSLGPRVPHGSSSLSLMRLSSKLPGLRHLMVRHEDLWDLDMRRLCDEFPNLGQGTLTFYLGGVDLDFRKTMSNDEPVCHILIDLMDRGKMEKMTALIQDFCAEYPQRRKYGNGLWVGRVGVHPIEDDVEAEWTFLCLMAQGRKEEIGGKPFARNRRRCFGKDWSDGRASSIHTLDTKHMHFLAVSCEDLPWSMQCRHHEIQALGEDRWRQLVGNLDQSICKLHVQFARTKQHHEALASMPQMRQVAIVRILGDVGDLDASFWEDVVEIGKTKERPLLWSREVARLLE